MSDVPSETPPPADMRQVKHTSEGLTPAGLSAVQGRSEVRAATGTDSPTVNEPPDPAQKGSDFEQWAGKNIFHGEASRLRIYLEDNRHLDPLGDGVGITKTARICDAYHTPDGAIWELKSGYEHGGIDQDQLEEYSLMERAGHVYVREGDCTVRMPVTSVNYLFDSEAAAKANELWLRGKAAPWYVDSNCRVQLLSGWEAKT